MKITKIYPLIILIVLSIVSSCYQKPYEAFWPEGFGIENELYDHFILLAKFKNPLNSKERFILTRLIVDYLAKSEAYRKLTIFLNYLCEHFPNDPYNSYYTTVVAQTYRKLNESPLAAYYYKKAFFNYPDLFYNGEFMHKVCLQELVKLSLDPFEQIHFCKLLLERFSSSIKKEEILYTLALAYEKIADYKQAALLYKDLLNQPGTLQFPPELVRQIREKLARYETKPTWVVRDLNVLVERIKTALINKNVMLLLSYKATPYFFALSWEQKKEAPPTDKQGSLSIAKYLANFLLKSNVKVAEKIDLSSTANEAYLKTEKWAFHTHTTWYFYFKKIEYGPDPEINGGWEWAGIYLGEKL